MRMQSMLSCSGRRRRDRARVRLSIFGSLFLSLCLLAQGKPAVFRPTHYVTQYFINQDIVEIPFEYVQHQILIHGDITGKKNLTFLFDTGATAPVLDKSIGPVGARMGDTRIKEAEGETTGQSVLLDEIRLGKENERVSVRSIPTLLTDISQLGRLLERKIDGIVGITFLAGFVTEIDYANHMLRFYNPRNYTVATRTPDDQRTFLFSLLPTNGNLPASTLLLAGELHEKYDYNFLLDTGFGGYLSVAQSAALESGLVKPETPRVAVTNFSVTRRFRSDKIRASYLMLGTINLSGRIVQVDMRNKDIYGQAGIVGNRLLQNYKVTLDYPRKKLWLERVTDRQEPDEVETPTLGLSIKADGKVMRVEKVARYSPAHHAGVKPGDSILAINGEPSDSFTPTQAMHLLSAPHGATTLALKRGVDPNLGTGGETYTLTLTPASPVDWTAGAE